MKKIQLGLIGFILALQSPAWAFDTVKFINFSDMHMSLKGKNAMKMGASSEQIVQTCVQTANQTPDLDFVVLTGDLLQDGEPYNLDMLRHYLDQLKVPYYVVLGNHDMSPVHAHDAPGPFFPAISKATVVWAFQGRGFQGPQLRWSQDPVPGLHLIGLDSTVPNTWGGSIPERDLVWLETDIKANPDKLCIPLAHHNFIEHIPDDYTTRKNFVIDNAAAVRQIFEKYPRNIQFAISGHHHLVSVRQHQGVTYYSNPSTTTYPTQYTLYTLTDQQLTHETKWVNLPPALIAEAKQHLLADPWWRPTQAKPGKEGDLMTLRQYEGEPTEQKGTLKLRPWGHGH